MRKTIAIATAVAALAAPAAAQAHVTLQPKQVPAGGFARLDVRVPNERDDAATTKVEVKFPPGFAQVSTEPVPGWTIKVARRPLAKPVVDDDGNKVTDEVDTVTWTGDGAEGMIAPGQFRDFGLSVGLPDKAGTTLTFKALQTYDNGEVVRWIGPPDGDEPAPQVELTAAAADGHGAATTGAASTTPAAAVNASDDDGDGAPTWLAVLALVVGVLGLLAGIGGLMAARRRTA
jgi:uncharacterized protein YcnI